MNKSSHFLDLDSGAVLRLRHAAGTRISVVRGCAWITQENDRRDIVVSPGRHFVLDRPGLAVVQMLEAGEICVDFVDPQRLRRTGPIHMSTLRDQDPIRIESVAVFPR